MGLGFFRYSSSSYDNKPCNCNCNESIQPPMPNPKNFKIVRRAEINNHAVVEVIYPDCTNYEGRKIMVYKNCRVDDLIKQKHLDPHFAFDKSYPSPFARFEPTEEGWKTAVKLIKNLKFFI